MQKGTAALFLLIIGLLIVGVIGVFFFGLFKSQTPLSSLMNRVPTPRPLTYSDQNYSNKNFGLEFQYPDKGFTVKEDSEEDYNKRGNGDFRKNFTGYVGYEPAKFLGAVVVLGKDQNFDTNPFSIWILDNPENLTTDKWFDKYWYYPFLWGVFDWTSKEHITPDQEATISGQTTKYKIITYQPGSPKYLYLSNKGNMYLFRVTSEKGDQILSSFRFLK